MTYTLSNDLLTVSIQDAGAQLCSVRSAGGTEYLWQADPAVWGRHAPLPVSYTHLTLPTT